MSSSSDLEAQLIKFKAKWKGKRNSQNPLLNKSISSSLKLGALVRFFLHSRF